jgi:hypothetical protein
MTVFEVEAFDFSPMKPKYSSWLHRPAACKDFLGYLKSRHPKVTFSMELGREH